MSLLDFSAEKHGLAVEKAWKALDVKGLGPTLRSKVLHLLHPRLFVPWDDEISRGYGVSRSSKGYLEFLGIMSGLARHLLEAWKAPGGGLEEARKDLEKRFQRPLTRIIDMLNWLLANPSARLAPLVEVLCCHGR